MPTENPVLSYMEKTVTRNLLKWAAGQVMFCPCCAVCMDWRKTVIIEINKGETLLKTYTVCTKCADERLPEVTKAADANGYTVTVTDSRKFK